MGKMWVLGVDLVTMAKSAYSGSGVESLDFHKEKRKAESRVGSAISRQSKVQKTKLVEGV